MMSLIMQYRAVVKMIPDDSRIGAVARRMRKGRRLTLAKASAAMGISLCYLSALERGYRSWTTELVEAFNKAMKQ